MLAATLLSSLALLPVSTLSYNVQYAEDCIDGGYAPIINRGLLDAFLLAKIGDDIAGNLADIPLVTRLFGGTDEIDRIKAILEEAWAMAKVRQDDWGTFPYQFKIHCPSKLTRPGNCQQGNGMWMDDTKWPDLWICPLFWDWYDAEYFDEPLPSVQNATYQGWCGRRPYALGMSGMGRPLYHETLHLTDSIWGKDENYGVGGEMEALYPDRPDLVDGLVLQAGDQEFASNNPDTYSFLTLFVWRRVFCGYPFTMPESLPPRGYPPFPTCSIDPDDHNCIACPVSTYPSLDLVPGSLPNGQPDFTVRIEVLYCRLRLREQACPKRWQLIDFPVYSPRDNQPNNLMLTKGCFPMTNAEEMEEDGVLEQQVLRDAEE